MFSGNVIKGIGSALFSGGVSVGKHALGSSLARVATGAIAGNLTGWATSDKNATGTDVFANRMAGTLMGAALGAATAKPLLKGIGKAIIQPLRHPGSAISKVNSLVDTGLKVTNWEINHPKTSIAMGIAGIGTLSYMATGEIGNAALSAETMGRITQESNIQSTGFSPGMGSSRQQEDRNAFMNSTQGLSFGLHANRH